jgi:hypothetical protein
MGGYESSGVLDPKYHPRNLSDKYLGLSAMVGVDTSYYFQHLIDRLCAIFIGLMGKILY